jgi:hypothetical protein
LATGFALAAAGLALTTVFVEEALIAFPLVGFEDAFTLGASVFFAALVLDSFEAMRTLSF